MFRSQIAAAALIATLVAGCDKPSISTPQPRPVRTTTVERGATGEIVSLTGQVRARDQGSVAFRLDGRMVERPVNVGDVVRKGQVIGRLDPQRQQNELRAAQASVAAAEAQLAEARLNFARKQELVKDGWVSRAQFDTAQQALRTTEAQLDSARAQLRIAQDQQSYTVLIADAPGVVTAVGAEPGEVVRAGQMIVQLAREGGLDAVFDVPEQLIRTGPRDPLVEIVLSDDPQVRATGRVREVAPQADSATRTFQVKVEIVDPPDAMRLGSTVVGRVKLTAPAGIALPAEALTEVDGLAAVWVLDPGSQTVSLRNVDVLRYDPAAVVISQGLETGEIVVTAGVQTLRPGQKVRVLGAAS
jgi:RND family efflux transporter MFP subunit